MIGGPLGWPIGGVLFGLADPANVDWWTNYTDPTRRKFDTVRLTAAATIDPWALTQPETTTADRWFAHLAEPVRFRYFHTELQGSFIGWHFPIDAFDWNWVEQPGPVRSLPGLNAALQQSFTVDAEMFPNPRELMTWFNNLADPQRPPTPGLAAPLQMAFTMPPRMLPLPTIFMVMDALESHDIALFAMIINGLAAKAIVSIEELMPLHDGVASIWEQDDD